MELAESGPAPHTGEDDGKENCHTNLSAREFHKAGEGEAGAKTNPARTDQDQRRSLKGSPEATRPEHGKHNQVEPSKQGVPQEQDERKEHGREPPQPHPERFPECQGVQADREGPDRSQ